MKEINHAIMQRNWEFKFEPEKVIIGAA